MTQPCTALAPREGVGASSADRSNCAVSTSSATRTATRGLGYQAAVQALAPNGPVDKSLQPRERRGAMPLGEENPFDPPGPKLVPSNKRFTGDSKLAAVMAGKDTVMRNSSGRHVRRLQAALEDLGHGLPTSHADALFGDETEGAVKSFQAASVEGAKPGVVDQPTMQRLDILTPSASDMRHEWREADVVGRAKDDRRTTPHLELLNPRFQGDTVLTMLLSGTGAITDGSKRLFIWKIQEALKDLGLLMRAEPGTYDAPTKAAVTAFQEAYNVATEHPQGTVSGFKSEAGFVGGSTMAALDAYAPRRVPEGGLPPAEADKDRPKYEKLFADGRLDVTIAIGQDERLTAHDIDQTLAARYLEDEMGFVKEPRRPSLIEDLNLIGLGPELGPHDTMVFKRSFVAKTTGKPVEVRVKLMAPNHEASNGLVIREMYKQAMEQDEVTMYSGHARAGTGPDFDPTNSSAGNYKMGLGYSAEYNAKLASADNQLDKTKFSDKYQLYLFSACKSQNYKPHMDKALAAKGEGVKKSKDIIYTTKDVPGASGIFGTLAVLRGLIAEESAETLKDLMNVSQRQSLTRIEGMKG